MSLQKQLVPLPLVGGINEKEGKLVSMRPRTMTNCVYRKTGEVAKRYGYECVGPYNLRSDATAPARGELLASFDDELVRIGGGRLDTYSVIGTTSDWVSRGRIPECIVETSGLVGAGVSADVLTGPALGYANGHLIAAYYQADTTGARIMCDVINVASGARIYSRYVIYSVVGSGLGAARVATSGNYAGIFFGTESNAVAGIFLDTSTMTFGTVGAAAVLVRSPQGVRTFDVGAVGDNEWVVAFEKTGGGGTVVAQRFARTQASLGTFDPVGSSVNVSTTNSALYAMSMRVTSTRIWLAYAHSTASSDVKVSTITTAFAVETAPFSVRGGSAANATRTIGIEATSTTTAIVAWTQLSTGLFEQTQWQEVTNVGAISYTPSRVLQNSCLLSRPLVRSGRAYMLIASQTDSVGTQFLIDMHFGESIPDTSSPRIVSCLLPQQLSRAAAPRSGTVCDWVAVDTNRYASLSLVAGSSTGSFAVVTLDAKFDDAFTRSVSQAGNLLVVGGGALSVYDGSMIAEVGFAYPPDSLTMVAAQGTGGSMTTSGVYGYVAVYAWTDARGNIHRGRTSSVLQTTLTSGKSSVALDIPSLHLTNKPGVFVEVYRTVSDGSTYYYVGSVLNNPTAGVVTYTDTSSDAVIAVSRSIYTTGGVKQHDIPAGGAHVVAWKGALLTHGSDDDSVWISGEVLAGEGPWFSSEFNLPAFEGGRVTAFAMLDTTPVVFKAARAFYLDGEPPTDTGSSSITAPRSVQTPYGCIDPRSIVTTPQGLYRMTETGIWMLDRSLVDQPVGKAVEDSYRDGFAAAAIVAAQGLVRFLQTGTDDYDVLNFDMHNGAWSKDVLLDVQASTDADPVAGVMYQGAFHWLSGAGCLYRESTTSYTDGAAWVTMSFETGVSKPLGAAGWQRVWRAHVLLNWQSSHNVTITVTTDNGEESRAWDATEIDDTNEGLMVHVADQKCRWMSVKVEDEAPEDGVFGTGAGFAIRDVSLVLGIKPSSARVPTANRK